MSQDSVPQEDSVRSESVSSRHPHATDPLDPEFVHSFADFLAQQNYVESAGVDRAIQAQKQTNQRFDVVLTQLGLMSDTSLLEAFAEYFDMEMAATAAFPITPILEDQLDADFVKRNRLLPLSDSDDEVIVACCDPFNTDTLAAISYLLEKPVAPRLAQGRDLDEAILRLYDTHLLKVDDADSLDGDDRHVNDDDIQRLRDIASEAPVIRLVNRIIATAAEQGASDIHIEPVESDVRVRFRIDGVMTETERLRLDVLAGVTSRIKILSKLNIAERRLPQDGRTKFIVQGREIDLRISTMPTLHGEGVVMRLLDTQTVDLSFRALGFDDKTCATFERMLGVPNGIVLVTGPTGSGKTTTLYAALKLLNSVERKVFTVEDPIEYQLSGVNQIQIKPGIGLDFLHCLRSILRQDPDVIMVGEMRDVETARMGIQASLTGHLVLSTLHTNSAASAITRLLDMGVEDYLLASSLTGIIAQRLVRKLCTDCTEPDLNNAEKVPGLLQELPETSRPSGSVTLMRSAGCSNCRHSGYRGRTSIVEALEINASVRQFISSGAGEDEIEAAGLANGMETLYQSALRKALIGETSLDEVYRVARM